MDSKTFTGPGDTQAVRELMDKQKALFDQHKADAAARGVDLMEERIARYLTTWREAVAFAPPGATVLDIGPGWMPPPLFDLLIHDLRLDYHAQDVEPTFVDDLAKRCTGLLPAQNFRAGEVSRVAFDKTFDLVFSSHCLEHSVDIVSSLVEIRRVLRENACLFMCVPLGLDLSDEHLLFHGPDEWVAMIQAAGFEVEKCTVGRIYAGAEVVIVARRSAGRAPDELLARAIAARFAKVGRTFLPHTHAAFQFPASARRERDHTVLQQAGDACRILFPANPTTVAIVRLDWAGSLVIEDGTRQLAVDAYHPFFHLHGVDITGFGREVTIRVVGRNGLSHASQGVIAGALVAS